MGEYEGWTELSPPAAYPSTMGNEANKDTFSLDTTSTLSTTTLACMQGLSVSIRALLLEQPPQGQTTNPQTSKSIA